MHRDCAKSRAAPLTSMLNDRFPRAPMTAKGRNRTAKGRHRMSVSDPFETFALVTQSSRSRLQGIGNLRTGAQPIKKARPAQVSFLSAEAIAKVSNPLPHLVQKPCGAQNRRAGFHGLFVSVFLHSLSTPNPGCKPLSGGNCDQNIPHRPFYPAGSAGYITLDTY